MTVLDTYSTTTASLEVGVSPVAFKENARVGDDHLRYHHDCEFVGSEYVLNVRRRRARRLSLAEIKSLAAGYREQAADAQELAERAMTAVVEVLPED